MPSGIRSRKTLWWVPRVGNKNGPSYGVGQANLWFANKKNNEAMNKYISKTVNQINSYDGKNCMLKDDN